MIIDDVLGVIREEPRLLAFFGESDLSFDTLERLASNIEISTPTDQDDKLDRNLLLALYFLSAARATDAFKNLAAASRLFLADNVPERYTRVVNLVLQHGLCSLTDDTLLQIFPSTAPQQLTQFMASLSPEHKAAFLTGARSFIFNHFLKTGENSRNSLVRNLIFIASALSPEQAIAIYADLKQRLSETFPLDRELLGIRSTELNTNIRAGGVAIFCEALRHCPDIDTFRLTDKNLGDDGAMFMARQQQEHPSLKILDLSSCQIGDAGATALADLLTNDQTLQYLILPGNNFTADGAGEFVRSLASNHTLQTLSFANVGYRFDFGGADTEAALVAQFADVLADNYAIQEVRGILPALHPLLERNRRLREHLPLLKAYLKEDTLDLEAIRSTVVNTVSEEIVTFSAPHVLLKALLHLAENRPEAARGALASRTFNNPWLAQIADKARDQATSNLMALVTNQNVAEYINDMATFKDLMSSLPYAERNNLFEDAKDHLVTLMGELSPYPATHFGYWQLYRELSPLAEAFIDCITHLTRAQTAEIYQALTEKIQLPNNATLQQILKAQCEPEQYRSLVGEKCFLIDDFTETTGAIGLDYGVNSKFGEQQCALGDTTLNDML